MWKKNLQNLFAQRTLSPQPEAWQRLQAQLDQHDAAQKQQKRKKYFWVAAAAAVLLLCLSVPFFWQTIVPASQQPNAVPVAASAIPMQPVVPIASTVSPNEPVAQEEEKTTSLAVAPQVAAAAEKPLDTLFAAYTADKIIAEVLNKLPAQTAAEMKMSPAEIALWQELLQEYSPNDLLLMATAENNLEGYIAQQYDAEKLLSDLEKEELKDRIQLFLNKLYDKMNQVKALALK